MIATSFKAKRISILLALIIGVTTVLPAYSAFLVKDYPRIKNDKYFRLYVAGVGDGIAAANAELSFRKQKNIFCAPTQLVLTIENYANILDQELRDNPTIYTVEFPVEIVLLKGLIKTFPCK